MAVTGFILWNPIAAARFLPGQAIPAAKAAHGGEALLAVLSILIWHFYGVHFRRFNRSMWTGKLSEEEMQHEHPIELAEIKAGTAERQVEPTAMKERQRKFLPVASVAAVMLLAGVLWFITFEETAVATVPARPTVEAFLPQTPTPLPPSPTPPPIGSLTWNAYIGTLVAAKCTSCHGEAGGLSLTTYAELQNGGAHGSIINNASPEASQMIAVQTTGDHPGILSPEELTRITLWIANGAPEE
jgi:mono/diheme cytochrome c family protein